MSQKMPENRETPMVRSPIFDDSQILGLYVHLAISSYTWPKDSEMANFQLEMRLVKASFHRTEKGRIPHQGTPRFMTPANAKRE